VALDVDRTLADPAAQSFQYEHGLYLVGARHHDDEFFAAPAPDPICLPQAPAKRLRHVDQNTITDGMTVAVVDVLEVIEIKHCQAVRLTGALAMRMNPLHRLPDAASVQKRRQLVVVDKILQSELGLFPS